ncbi:hypothetical protein LIER_00361 [Lithospermum erythrorhizon]|uniref:Bacterial surface antigen (D15) domain-containing protein n=1 Tax=Lithospermum erythrorhizon TaxID=34254 RepID=A0AAV3NH30_LITER
MASDDSAASKVNDEEPEVNDEEPEVNDEEIEVNDDRGETRSKMEKLMKRLRTEKVNLRVHNILIKGNTKTKESVIEAELEPLKSASTVQEMLVAAQQVQMAIQRLNVFDSVEIVLDSGPIELPGTANVVVQVVEAKKVWFPDLGMFAKPEARSWWMQGSLNFRNLFGYGDIWDGSLAYGLNQASEISTGVSLPRFRRLSTPVTARVSLLSQDWLKFSSYKEQALGLSLGLLSTENHDLSYNLSWRTLMDPSQMSSKTVRKQLGHRSVSALKYTFSIDRRNSSLRPTRGYAFLSTSQIGGLIPDFRSMRFIRQEFDFRYALPLGFYRAALNFGISAGVVLPWGSGSSSMPSYLPDRYFVGGNSSPVCTIGGPTLMWGFKTRGLGPVDPRREVREDTSNEHCESSSELDYVGGDLALTAFVDMSFDLPLKVLRDAGIHGHAFACTGSLNKLTEKAYRDLSFHKFLESFRSSAGFGIVVPTKFFRMEVNYCHILKQQEYDRGKTGLQFSFSSPL